MRLSSDGRAAQRRGDVIEAIGQAAAPRSVTLQLIEALQPVLQGLNAGIGFGFAKEGPLRLRA